MTKKDFETILIESFEHETKQSYFEGKRKLFDCNHDEYLHGLYEALERINNEVSTKDYNFIRFTKLDGEIFECELLPTDHSGQINHLNKEFDLHDAKISYPNTKNIAIYELGRLKMIITSEHINTLGLILNAYFESIKPQHPVNTQQKKTLLAHKTPDQLKRILLF